MGPGPVPRSPFPSRRARDRAWGSIYVIIGISLFLWYWSRSLPWQRGKHASLEAGSAETAGLNVTARLEQDARDLRELLAQWPPDKPKAAIFMLSRNSEARAAATSLLELETSFNDNATARYPYVIVNDKPFSASFVSFLSASLRGRCYFGQVPREHWSYPAHADARLIRGSMASQVAAGVFHGGEESYHFMCRYFSGFFMNHPLLEGFDYYWRVEPGVHFFCHLPSDPFREMRASGAVYGWNIVRAELMNTIPSLWNKVVDFLEAAPQLLHPNGSLALFTRDGAVDWGAHPTPVTALRAAEYGGCHFWSNFEIGRLDFFRGEAYQSLFRWLDSTGGFFLERWGDAPVHSLAVAALLDAQTAVRQFEGVGYRHDDAMHCPQDPAMRPHCDCMPSADYHIHRSTCYRLLAAAGLAWPLPSYLSVQ